MRGATVGHVWDWAASERRFMIMVPRSMASSMGKRVAPGIYIAQLDLKIGTCLRNTHPTVFLSLFPAITILADTNNDLEAIVPSTQALGPIADEGKHVILK